MYATMEDQWLKKPPPQTVKIIKFHHMKMRLLQFLQILLILIMNINLHLHPNSSYYQMCISKRQKNVINVIRQHKPVS